MYAMTSFAGLGLPSELSVVFEEGNSEPLPAKDIVMTLMNVDDVLLYLLE